MMMMVTVKKKRMMMKRCEKWTLGVNSVCQSQCPLPGPEVQQMVRRMTDGASSSQARHNQRHQEELLQFMNPQYALFHCFGMVRNPSNS